MESVDHHINFRVDRYIPVLGGWRPLDVLEDIPIRHPRLKVPLQLSFVRPPLVSFPTAEDQVHFTCITCAIARARVVPVEPDYTRIQIRKGEEMARTAERMMVDAGV